MIIKNKIASVFLIVSVVIAVYSGLILFDVLGPTSDYDKKIFGRLETIDDLNGKPVMTYSYLGEYRSKGVISVNKEIQFYIYELQYYFEKETLKDADIIMPDNFTAELCPDDAITSRDLNWQKNFCINVKLEKSVENTRSIKYSINRNYENNIGFQSSGLKGLNIRVEGSPIGGIHNSNVFEIEPYSTYLQIQLQKYTYILSLLGIIVVLFQIYEFRINHLKK